MTIDLFIALTSFAVGMAAMLLALRKQRMVAATPSPSEELRQKVLLLERDVASLQRMLVEKQNEIDKLNERIRQLERGVTPVASANAEKRKVLLVCIGAQQMLEEDNAMLRKVQAQTNIRLTRLLPVTKASLKRTIDRHRAQHTPIEYVHFAVHASPEGLEFEDGMASGLWLSQQLGGVKIALLAGCNTDQVADLLTVVPAVVSLREEIANRDAALFATAFWMGVGQGLAVEEAFEHALSVAPSVVSEFAELHL